MWDLLQYDFARNALLAALILGPACALLGVFVTLRGQSFLSDALAHSAVTGVALGILMQQTLGWPEDTTWAVLPFCLVLALGISVLSERSDVRPDAIITASFVGSLALGVIILNSVDRYTLLDGILFGNIYAIDRSDLLLQGVLAAGLVTLLLGMRRQFLLTLLNPDLARLQGVRTSLMHHVLALAVAVTVALCIKMTGALLLSALIVVPAVAGRVVARSFGSLLILSMAFGLIGPSAGVFISLKADLPTGPVMVLTLLAILICAFLFGTISRRMRTRVSQAT
jgi:zinc transport system permease protein